MSTDLTPAEHEVAARECDAIAATLEKLSSLHDGSLAPYLERQHLADAMMVRARAETHRRCAAEAHDDA